MFTDRNIPSCSSDNSQDDHRKKRKIMKNGIPISSNSTPCINLEDMMNAIPGMSN